MRVRVKTLTRRTFGIDVHPTASIEELKVRLAQETGIPLSGQKLVYKGEVLHSGCVNKLIAEDDFLVVIVVRPQVLRLRATTVLSHPLACCRNCKNLSSRLTPPARIARTAAALAMTLVVALLSN